MVKKSIKIAACLLTALLSISSIEAQNGGGREIGMKIFFPYDEARIDSTYMENSATLQRVDTLLRDTSYISTLSRVKITAQSSLEGGFRYNERLSSQRRDSLANFFATRYPQIDSTL